MRFVRDCTRPRYLIASWAVLWTVYWCEFGTISPTLTLDWQGRALAIADSGCVWLSNSFSESPDTNPRQKIEVWDLKTGRRLPDLPPDDQPLNWDYHDWQFLKKPVFVTRGGVIHQIDPRTGQSVQRFDGLTEVKQIFPSPDGTRFVVLRTNGQYELVNPKDGSSLRTLEEGLVTFRWVDERFAEVRGNSLGMQVVDFETGKVFASSSDAAIHSVQSVAGVVYSLSINGWNFHETVGSHGANGCSILVRDLEADTVRQTGSLYLERSPEKSRFRLSDDAETVFVDVREKGQNKVLGHCELVPTDVSSKFISWRTADSKPISNFFVPSAWTDPNGRNLRIESTVDRGLLSGATVSKFLNWLLPTWPFYDSPNVNVRVYDHTGRQVLRFTHPGVENCADQYASIDEGRGVVHANCQNVEYYAVAKRRLPPLYWGILIGPVAFYGVLRWRRRIQATRPPGTVDLFWLGTLAVCWTVGCFRLELILPTGTLNLGPTAVFPVISDSGVVWAIPQPGQSLEEDWSAIQIWDVKTARQLPSLPTGDKPTITALRNLGDNLLMGNPLLVIRDGTTHEIDPLSGLSQRQYPIFPAAEHVYPSPDGKQIVVQRAGQRFDLVDAEGHSVWCLAEGSNDAAKKGYFSWANNRYGHLMTITTSGSSQSATSVLVDCDKRDVREWASNWPIRSIQTFGDRSLGLIAMGSEITVRDLDSTEILAVVVLDSLPNWTSQFPIRLTEDGQALRIDYLRKDGRMVTAQRDLADFPKTLPALTHKRDRWLADQMESQSLQIGANGNVRRCTSINISRPRLNAAEKILRLVRLKIAAGSSASFFETTVFDPTGNRLFQKVHTVAVAFNVSSQAGALIDGGRGLVICNDNILEYYELPLRRFPPIFWRILLIPIFVCGLVTWFRQRRKRMPVVAGTTIRA